MYCKYCQCKINPGDTNCSHCGAPLDVKDAAVGDDISHPLEREEDKCDDEEAEEKEWEDEVEKRLEKIANRPEKTPKEKALSFFKFLGICWCIFFFYGAYTLLDGQIGGTIFFAIIALLGLIPWRKRRKKEETKEEAKENSKVEYTAEADSKVENTAKENTL